MSKDNEPTPAPTSTPTPIPAPQVGQGADGLLAQVLQGIQGTIDGFARRLDKIESPTPPTTATSVPSEGVNDGLLQQYKALGTPEEIKLLTDKAQGYEAERKLRDIATATGTNYDVLAMVAGDTTAFDVKDDGKVFVGEKSFEDYANEQWAHLSASLFVSQVPPAVNFPKTGTPLTTPNNESIVDSHIAAMTARNTGATTK